MTDDYMEGLVNEAVYWASSVPVLGSAVRAIDNHRYINDYMRNSGLDWSDVRYPSRLIGAGSAGGVVSFVSSNIKNLYR